MTECHSVVAFGCSERRTAATVLVSAKKTVNKKTKAEVGWKEEVKARAESEKGIQEVAQISAEKKVQKTFKKPPDEPYEENLTFSTPAKYRYLKETPTTSRLR